MNLEERKRIYSEVQKLILEDAPMIFLFQPKDNYGVRDRVKGFKATGDEKIFYQEISTE
jgi:ABC-type transport system substrate-binding protein